MNHLASTARRLRGTFAGATCVLALLATSTVQAFPSLGLTPGLPDISSPAQIEVDYAFNDGTGIGTLSAMGGASQLALPGTGVQNIVNGVFNLVATINTNDMTATGGLTITGTSDGAGGNFPSALLTTANLVSFGAGDSDPLEFIFDTLGGSLASVFGSKAGVILSNTGYTGLSDLTDSSGFNSGGSGATADTFAVPEPGTLALMLLSGGALFYSRRKRNTRLGHTEFSQVRLPI